MITHLFAAIIGNALALIAAAYVVHGFDLNLGTGWQAFAGLVGVLTVISLIIKPLLRLFLGPIIIITFGLFNVIINGGLLYIVDKYSENLTITGLPALIYGTVIITIVGVFTHSILKTSGD
jgi:uncharacterized membrane protein YvlD (DUF360 family)